MKFLFAMLDGCDWLDARYPFLHKGFCVVIYAYVSTISLLEKG